MTTNQLIAVLERAEISPRIDADARRVMREERFSLLAAVSTLNNAAISAARAEAIRVARMWGVL